MRTKTMLMTVFLMWSASVAMSAEEALGPEEAAKKVNEKVTLEMEVKSTGGKDSVFLNSETDFKKDGNFTVFLSKVAVEKFAQAKIDKPAEHFKGKTIRVKGSVTLHNDKPQIKVDQPDQIEIVEKNEKK